LIFSVRLTATYLQILNAIFVHFQIAIDTFVRVHERIDQNNSRCTEHGTTLARMEVMLESAFRQQCPDNKIKKENQNENQS